MKDVKFSGVSAESVVTVDINNDVFLDRKKIGKIKKTSTGFVYFPKGQRTGGDSHTTEKSCFLSIL